MGRRAAVHAGRSISAATDLELPAEMSQLFFVLLLEVQVHLLHVEDLFTDMLHFADLGLDLVLVGLGGTALRAELRPDLLEKLLEARLVDRRRCTAHGAMRIHGHGGGGRGRGDDRVG